MLNLTWRDRLRTCIYKRNLVAFVIDCVIKWEARLIYKYYEGFKFFFNSRGDFLRTEFSNLGDDHSLIPPHAYIMGINCTYYNSKRGIPITK